MPTQPAEPASSVRYLILGTAGHIDHGKTALVRALTGTDTDRLPEERRRGMTIELGFAHLSLGNVRMGLVDVPGHERFVRTMVAGATGIDLALIVVAADDSVMPQTVEHVEILHLLGVDRAVVAISKIDAVEAEMIDWVADDVRTLLAGTALDGAPIVPVSAQTGQGLDALRSALREVASGIDKTTADAPFRMAVDRVFTVRGRGTVVTGSVLRGRVAPGDVLEVWPGGSVCRVRELQSHGEHTEHLTRGRRAALNLTGMDRAALERGVELATPGYLTPSRLVDVRLRCLNSHPRGLRTTRTVRLCVGTSEVPVRVVLLDTERLEPGQSGFAQLRAGHPIVAAYGQRLIVRDDNAVRTIGGGVVLRPVARRRRRSIEVQRRSLEQLEHGDALGRLEEALRDAGFSTPDDLSLSAATGIDVADLPAHRERLTVERRWVTIPGTDARCVPSVIEAVEARLLRRLERYHRLHPDEPGRHIDAVLGRLAPSADRAVARALLDDLLRDGRLKRIGAYVGLPGFTPSLSAADDRLLARTVRRILDGGFSPPTISALRTEGGTQRKRMERLIRIAAATGQLVRITDDVCIVPEVEARLRRAVADLISARTSVSVADVREALKSSRKYCVPYLEYLDRITFTKRVGDRRVLADGSDA